MFALEPGELGRVTLTKHEEAENAPYCVVRSMSMREQRAYAAEYDAIFESDRTRDEFFDNVIAMFKQHVVSIHGYQSDDPEDAFNKDGMIEILRRLLGGKMVSHEEKKS